MKMKVVSVKKVKLENPVRVYDLTVYKYQNFKLADGCFVHNSKDVSDSLAGAVYGIQRQKAVWLQHGISYRT